MVLPAGSWFEILRRYRPFAARRLATEGLNVYLAPFLSHLDEDALAGEIREPWTGKDVHGVRHFSGEERADFMVQCVGLPETIDLVDEPYWPPVGDLGKASEALHGVARAGIATVFPQAISLAAM
mgnify:CR=1 FL=1